MYCACVLLVRGCKQEDERIRGTYDISTTGGLALGILFVERQFYVFDDNVELNS